MCARQRPGWTDGLAKSPDHEHIKALNEPLGVGPKPNTQIGEQVPRKGGKSRPGKKTLPAAVRGTQPDGRMMITLYRARPSLDHSRKPLLALARSLSDASAWGSNLK